MGRDRHRAYCLLFEDGIDEEGSQRLQAVATTQSGFDLAELDLRLRGPGDVAGLRQHGLPEMRAADLLDFVLAQRARAAARRLAGARPRADRVRSRCSVAMHGVRHVFDLD